MPWEKPTRQVQGRTAEKRLAEALGFSLHPMSGAGYTKGDASDEDWHVEMKDAAKSFTLTGRFLRLQVIEASQVGKMPLIICHFRDEGLTAVIQITDNMKEVVQDGRKSQ